jgi:hypothetical protein
MLTDSANGEVRFPQKPFCLFQSKLHDPLVEWPLCGNPLEVRVFAGQMRNQ